MDKMLQKITNEELVREMLKRIGENPNREGLKDTPKRVVKMWKEIYKGYNKELLPKITTFNNGCDGIVYDELISVAGTFNSYCEHHTSLFSGRWYFAYLPNSKGKILGLSKVARVVEYFSSRLQIQERLVHDICEYIWNILNKNNNPPLGIALIMEAEHTCKSMRGIKNRGRMRTAKLMGVFKTDDSAKKEFMNWVNNYKEGY